MTNDELTALPAWMSIELACRALGIPRSAGYALAKTGEFPIKISKIGNQYRVPKAGLLTFLGIATGKKMG